MPTRKIFRSLLAVIGIVIWGQGHAACEEQVAGIRNTSPQKVAERIRSLISASNFACAIENAQSWQTTIPSLSPEDQVSSRFAFRELALAVAANATYPIDRRLALLTLAATTAVAKPSDDDLRADSRTMFLGAREFQTQNQPGAYLEALIEALKRDRLLPSGARAINQWEVMEVAPQTRGREFLPQLLSLAEVTRGDKDMVSIREKLAFTLFYNMSVWRETDKREDVEKRASDVLKLTEMLIDVPTCYGCGDKWYWQPIMKVGTAYQRIGMKGLADQEIRRALSIVRAIGDRNQRLYRLNFALIDLLGSKYDERAIVEIVLEINQLAHSMDTPTAAESRERLPKIIKIWKIDVSLPSSGN